MKAEHPENKVAKVQARRGKSFWALVVPGMLCFLIAFLAYAHTIGHGFVADDTAVLRDNRFIHKGWDGIPDLLNHTYRKGAGIEGDGLYRPLSQVMFAIEWSLSPNNPFIHHAVSILVYALGAWLLFLLLVRFFPSMHRWMLFWMALLFILHPIHTEVVANIKSRDELMAFVFILLGFLAFHAWLAQKRWFQFAGMGLLFFLALLSREGAITMLVMIPLAGWFFWKASLKECAIGFVVLAFAASLFLMIRHQVLSAVPPIYSIIPLDNVLVAAPDPLTRFATAIFLLGKYLGLLFFPHPLVSDYSFNQIPFVGLFHPYFLLSFVALAFFLYWIIRHFSKKDPLVYGLVWLAVAMSIYSNLFILIGSSFAERFLFLGSVGFCLAFCFVLLKMAGQDKADIQFSPKQFYHRNPWLGVGVLLILILYAGKTYIRAGEWQSQQSLISRDVQRSPLSARMHLQMGINLRDQARNEPDPNRRRAITLESLKSFRTAHSIYAGSAEIMDQMGLAFYLLGKPDSAHYFYEKALGVNPLNPETWNNLASLYVERNDLQKALDLFQHAIDLNPDYVNAWQNKGSVLARMGQYEAAQVCFQKCIYLEPGNVLAYQLMALSYQQMGQADEAVRWQEKALSLESGQER